jgi:hypothetical protein
MWDTLLTEWILTVFSWTLYPSLCLLPGVIANLVEIFNSVHALHVTTVIRVWTQTSNACELLCSSTNWNI